MNTTVVFEAGGALEKCITVRIIDDVEFESTESFALQYSVSATNDSLLNPSTDNVLNVVNSEGTIDFNILDDDS